MMGGMLRGAVLAGVLCVSAVAVAGAQSIAGQPAPGFEATVEGGRVSLEWQREFGPSYLGHTIYAAYAPGGPIILQQFVPPIIGPDGPEPPSVSYPVVAPGTYYVIVLFGMVPPTPGLDAAWTRIDVGAGCTSAPEIPQAFWDDDDGDANRVDLRWSASEHGCPAEWFVMEAGGAPGLADIAIFPVQGTSFTGYPPAGTYHLRVRAANRFGGSSPSEEIIVTVTGCDAPAAPVGFAATVTGHTVHLAWAPPLSGGIQTITGYELIAQAQWPPIPSRFTLPASATSLTVPNVPSGVYYVQMAANSSCPSGFGLPTEILTVLVP